MPNKSSKGKKKERHWCDAECLKSHVKPTVKEEKGCCELCKFYPSLGNFEGFSKEPACRKDFRDCPCHTRTEEQSNFLQVQSVHCFKCHKDFKDPNHTITCKERLAQNKDGGAMSCRRLNGGECEFREKCQNPQCGRKLTKDNTDGYCHNAHCEFKVSPSKENKWEESFDDEFVKKPTTYRENYGWTVPYVNSRADKVKDFIHSLLSLQRKELEAEVVICAAIRMKDGYIIRGHRHSDAIATMKGIPRYKDDWAFGADQGFVTSRNRYVDRLEGARIQKAAGIKSKMPEDGAYLHGELYSEDLY